MGPLTSASLHTHGVSKVMGPSKVALCLAKSVKFSSFVLTNVHISRCYSFALHGDDIFKVGGGG